MNLTDKLAAFFRERPNQRIAVNVLAALFGYGGWRTRLDEARDKYGMDIRNEQEREGTRILSYYRYVPAVPETTGSDPYDANTWGLRG